MKAEIYYFTGTGNSLVVARDIAEKISAKLISIPSVMDQEKVDTNAGVIGIVCPVYYEPFGGLPLIVRRFVGMLDNLEDKYIFTICTYGSGGTMALSLMEKLLRERHGSLSAGFRVNMPENMAGPKVNTVDRQQKMFAVWDNQCDRIANHILAGEKGGFDTPNVLVGRLYLLIKLLVPRLMAYFKNMTLQHMQKVCNTQDLSYEQMMNAMDRSFGHNERCTKCGTCARVCPVSNIEIISDQPVWQHHCEFCLACFHWCPQGAITCAAFPGMRQYHHPRVKLSEMLQRDA